MITRIYIDNYKCFSNFEYKPGQNQLLLGRNGSGKSTVFEILHLLKRFILDRSDTTDLFTPQSRTRWDQRDEQTLELDIADVVDAVAPFIDTASYRYRLLLSYCSDGPRLREEELLISGIDGDWEPVYQRSGEGARLYNDVGDSSSLMLVIPYLSGLSLIEDSPNRTRLSRFKQRLARMHVLQIDPRRMRSWSDAEEPAPSRDVANYVSWYRHLVQDNPTIAATLFRNLADVIEGFTGFRLGAEGTRRLEVLTRSNGRQATYDFGELSDGQRALAALHTVTAVIQASKEDKRSPSISFCIDEPENYVALAELQPWILTVEDALDQSRAQVLVASHHPEFINMYAGSDAVRLYREKAGPVRLAQFLTDDETTWAPAEIIARGWEDE